MNIQKEKGMTADKAISILNNENINIELDEIEVIIDLMYLLVEIQLSEKEQI